jgi:hypothetical protein
MVVYSLGIPLSHLVQPAVSLPAYDSDMELRKIKSAAAAVWVLAAIVVGLVAGVASLGGLVLLAALGLLLLWNDPSQSMSESIQQGRR